MSLASVVLNSKRSVKLTHLEIFSTYGGLLEGYPNVRMNDRLLARLARRPEAAHQSQPVHLIAPPRHRPDAGTDRRMPFGPFELLPAVYCRGMFESSCIDESLNDVLHRSWLTVVWFQDDLAAPVADFVHAAIAALAWEEHAEDYEL